jgi:hypothetical protein
MSLWRQAMDKIFELTVRFAYRRALAFGVDDRNAFEAALSVIFDAKPDLEEAEARIMLSIILGATADLAEERLAELGVTRGRLAGAPRSAA